MVPRVVGEKFLKHGVIVLIHPLGITVHLVGVNAVRPAGTLDLGGIEAGRDPQPEVAVLHGSELFVKEADGLQRIAVDQRGGWSEGSGDQEVADVEWSDGSLGERPNRHLA